MLDRANEGIEKTFELMLLLLLIMDESLVEEEELEVGTFDTAGLASLDACVDGISSFDLLLFTALTFESKKNGLNLQFNSMNAV